MHSATVAAAATVRRVIRCGVVGLVAALLLAALACAPPAATVHAATVTVMNCSDSGAGSLRDAITNAMPNDTITFAQNCNGATTPNTTITLLSTLTLSKNVTIDATVGGRTVTISGGSAVQLFFVNFGVSLGLTGLTLTRGNSTEGGAISNSGTMTITNSTLTGNSGFYGGAIYNNGTLNITGSTLSGNDVNYGGAIYGRAGTVNITGSTLSDNGAQYWGGAIYTLYAAVNITDSTLSGNSATEGGAIYTISATLTITGSTLSGNNGSSGGAIYTNLTATITNSTLSGNSGFYGGAIYNAGIAMTITGSTLSGNSVGDRFTPGLGGAIANDGPLTLTLSVMAGNTASGDGPDIYNVVNYGSVTSGGGNVVGVTPLLGPLADNGGPVQTLALLPGSPAIDIAACPVGLTTDARAVSRPQGTNCDAGAYEARAFTAGTLTDNNQTTLISTAFGAPVGLTVTGVDPVTNGQITFTITPGGTGASAAFGTAPMGCTNTSGTVSVCTVGMGGVTTSPTFTANGTAGGFTIRATASGVPTTTFTETNGIVPIAANDTYTTAANTALTVNAATGVLANDTPGTPAATITANTQPAHGSVTVNADGSFVYTPTSGYVGSDSFTYAITNSVGMSTGTVSLTVTGTAPTEVNDSYTVTTGTTLTVNAMQGVLANDTKGNPPATITANTQPAHGSVTLNADGSFVYTPTTGYVGADSFTYTLTNAVSGSTGTVNLTVTGTAPTATNDSYTVTTGLTLTVPAATGMLANDMKGAPVATISAHTQPAHGTLMLTTTDGSFVYTPTSSYVGADSFTYTLTNSVGTSTGTVSLTVTAATVTGLTTTAPTGAGSGNTGTASNPVLPLGGKLTLGTTASYNNGTTGTTSGISYTSSNPQVASVDSVTGVVTANTGGTAIMTVTGPNGSRTTITITVPGTAGTGLMPLPQPMTHPAAAATAAATPLPQPTRHP